MRLTPYDHVTASENSGSLYEDYETVYSNVGRPSRKTRAIFVVLLDDRSCLMTNEVFSPHEEFRS